MSNCPLCAIGDDANKTRIYKPNEMDADHVTAWSKGGDTDLDELPDAVRHPQPRQGQPVEREPSQAIRYAPALARTWKSA